MKFMTEVVNGVCPDCSRESVLISVHHFFKCTRCGSELEQKVNGKISYIPSGATNINMVLKEGKNGKSS
jgi:transcription initiation factor IIE alpha subunit